MAVSVHFEESVRACLFDANFVLDYAKPIHKTIGFVFKQLHFPLKCFKNDSIHEKNSHITMLLPPPPF